MTALHLKAVLKIVVG